MKKKKNVRFSDEISIHNIENYDRTGWFWPFIGYVFIGKYLS